MTLDLRRYIRDVPDYPLPGILFRDITPLILNPEAFDEALNQMVRKAGELEFHKVASVESRGFIFGAPLAHEFGVGFVPLRKEKKLPFRTRKIAFDLEYGKAVMEIHEDAVQPGEKVLIVDDLLATGGTARAAAKLVKELGGIVTGYLFLIELTTLQGRAFLEGEFPSPAPVLSIIPYA